MSASGPAPLGAEVVGRGLAGRGRRGPVFAGVDLDVPAGGLAVVHGPGGSGRSALLLALGGRFRLAAGELRVGDDLASAGLAPLRAASAVARVRPAIEPDEGLRVRDLERWSVLASAGRSDADAIEDAYALLGVAPDRGALLGDLHPLDALLVVVAHAAAEGRPVVLVDDVDAGLAPADVAAAWTALDALADAGPTVLASALAPPDGVDHVPVPLGHPTRAGRAVARDVATEHPTAAPEEDRPGPPRPAAE
ncbi:hypothetical protein ACVU7I_05570, partial [Patulibacter sp. S7RM1-6]